MRAIDRFIIWTLGVDKIMKKKVIYTCENVVNGGQVLIFDSFNSGILIYINLDLAYLSNKIPFFSDKIEKE